MTQDAPIGNLPGQFLGSFEGGSVLYTWEGYPSYARFRFFEAPKRGISNGRCKNLICVEVNSTVVGVKEAEALGKAVWSAYRETILAGKGERIAISPPLHD